jgi:hypothetical protein
MNANKPKTADEVVIEAKKRFERAKEANSEARKLALDDTRFVMGDSDNGWQWPESIRREREGDERVILTVNMTAQHCNQIINEIRRNRPSVKVSPVDSGADKETAEILGGLIRNIQVSSAADDAHDVAAEHAVYGGEGYWRVLTQYSDETSFNQDIVIKACPRPGLVYIDPDCLELDKSDAMWGFVFEDISHEQAKREHPEIDPQSWVEDGWMREDTIRRAEYFYCTLVKETACLLQDGSSVLKSALKPGQIVVKERPTQVKKWKWCKLIGGHDKPVDETDWLGDYLPIISVVGKEIYVGDELVRKGQVRDLKDPARMVNYAYSETAQTLALQNKIPYMAAAEAIEGYDEEWQQANSSNASYLPFHAYDQSGNPLPQPARQQPSVMPAAQVQFLQLSTEQMRAASGQQNANFGIKSEAQSGIGIERLKVQGETATFHFPDNLARALRYEAKVLINLIQKYYDTARVVRILGLDGKEEHVRMEPGFGQYHEQPDEDGEIQKIFDPLVGKYDVVVDTGPNYQTQRQESAASLNELAAKNPALMGIAGDLIMRAQDFPMSEQLAERLAKALPPGLQDKKDGQPEIPPEVQQQMQQMHEQMQQMDQALQQAHGELQQAQSGAQAKVEQAHMDAQIKAHQSDIDAEAKRQQAAIDLQFAREKADIDAQLAIEKAQIEQQTKLQIAQMNIEADAQIAVMQQMAQPNPAQAPEQEPMRKTITITGPSGTTYIGEIICDGDEQKIGINGPSGDYAGSIK